MKVRNILWPEEQDTIFEHIGLVHGASELEPVAAWYGSTPHFDPQDCFVIDGDNGQIAAHACLIPRQIHLGSSIIPASEISVMGVLEPYRGRGYGSRLMDAMHYRMSERGDGLGLAIGIPNFYERWHYEYAAGLYLTSYESDILTDLALKAGSWDSEHSYERRTADRLGIRGREVEVRRFNEKDLSDVQELYDEECALGHYLIARDEETWRWQLDLMARVDHYEMDDFLVAEIEDQIVAYVRMISRGQPINWFAGAEAASFTVIEAAGSDPDAIEMLLGEVARVGEMCGAGRIGLFVHPRCRLVQHALARGASLRTFTGAAHLRLHNLGIVLERMIPTLEKRLSESPYASRACHLIISTEREEAGIHLGMGQGDLVELEVLSSVLIRLITGWYGIDHLSAGYSERHADLLRVLFPASEPKIALADLI
ncbi:MAG: GNAT family N-acetyltransferase [Chloroflexi bacterium]|nr:MAG: GNAT family N-acetyltransferase [Chloroflexota bacterium]